MGLPNIIQQINTKLPLSGGNINGNLVFCNTTNTLNHQICVNNNSSYLEFYGGTNNNSSILQLYGNEYTANENHKASVRILTGITNEYSTRKELLLKPDGTLTWCGNLVVCVTKWTSENSGYRKYSDGFIEQWGISTGGGTSGRSITFPLAFSNTNYNIQMSVMDGSESDGQFAIGSWSNKTASSVKFWTTYNGGLGTWTFCWYCFGY